MKEELISAKVPAKDDSPEMSATVSINFPETLEEAKEMFGEDAVLSNALAHWKVTLQARIRSGLKRGETQERLQEVMKDARMGVAVKGAKADPISAFMAKFQQATPEEQAKMLEQLQQYAQGTDTL